MSLLGDRRLFDGFWRLAAPESWQLPEDVMIHDEDVLAQGRIDIVLDCDGRHVLGVEVKTTDASSVDGQLSRYADGLREKYPGRDRAIAYLTPFNREHAGQAAERLRSVREYERFREMFDHCTHLSWLDVHAVAWDSNELWQQHKHTLRRHLCTGASSSRCTRSDAGLFSFLWR